VSGLLARMRMGRGATVERGSKKVPRKRGG
jgi:hypothetical protein